MKEKEKKGTKKMDSRKENKENERQEGKKEAL